MRSYEPLFGKILVPVKESSVGKVTPHSLALARATGGELIFLHIQDHASSSEDPPPSFVRQAMDQAARQDVRASYLLRSGEVVDTICKTSHQLQADVVMLVSRPDSDHVERIHRELFLTPLPMATPCPVLVVPNVAPRAPDTSVPPRRHTY